MHVVGPLSEKDVTLALAPHQRQSLAGQRLLEEFRGPAALERKVHIALIGDHRALSRHERLAKTHAQQLRILVRDGLRLFLAEPPVDQIAGDTGETVTRGTGDSLGLRALRLMRPALCLSGVLARPAAVARPCGLGGWPPVGARPTWPRCETWSVHCCPSHHRYS